MDIEIEQSGDRWYDCMAFDESNRILANSCCFMKLFTQF